MSDFDHLRRAALALPGVEEGEHRGGQAFRVRGRAFALWWAQGARTILKLDRNHQVFLFDVRPEVFEPCPVGTGVWSFVDLAALEDEEVDALTREAWNTVAPAALRRPGSPPWAEKT
jgi:hypothetical protein